MGGGECLFHTFSTVTPLRCTLHSALYIVTPAPCVYAQVICCELVLLLNAGWEQCLSLVC